MARDSGQASMLLRRLSQLVPVATAGEPCDAELLHRFLVGREEAAFAALMQRHGLLVWTVCRNVLHQEQDIEDAFQATFLLLARKASSIRKLKAVGCWLHGVAYRVAMTARRSNLRRRAHDNHAENRAMEQPVAEVSLRELQALLDEEVERLPEKYRLPFILCCLEGKTKSEAASELGWKEGTVSSRLAHARQRLQDRLVRRGVTLSGVLCARSLTAQATAAPPTLVAGTIQAALNPGTASGFVAERVVALLRQSSGALLPGRALFGLVLILGVLVAGVGLLACGTAAPSPKADPPPPPKANVARTDPLGDALPAGALTRLGSARLRMGGAPLSVACSPDGKHVAAVGHDPKVYLWSADNGKEVARFTGHDGYVTAVRFFPDGKTLASAGHDGTIRIWDITSRSELRSLKHKGARVLNLAITPDGKKLVASNLDKTITVWDLAESKITREIALSNGGYAELIAITGDGKHVVWGGMTQGLHIDEMAGETTSPPIHPKFSMVEGLACSRNGKLVAWGGSPAGVRLVDIATRKQVKEMGKTPAHVRALAFSPDDKLIACSGHDMKVWLWDIASGKEQRSLEGSTKIILNLVFSPDGKRLAAACTDSVVRIWDTASGKLVHDGVGHQAPVGAVVWTPDGKEILSGSEDQTVRLWDVSTGKEKGIVPGGTGYVVGLALTPDGKSLISTGINPTVLAAWKFPLEPAGKKPPSATQRFAGITGMSFDITPSLSPDGKVLAATDNRVAGYFWDTATGKALEPLKLPKEPRRGIAFSPDGRTVALRTREGILSLWDLTTGREIRQLGKKTRTGPFAFSADGRSILALDATLHLFEVASGEERWDIKVPLDFLPCLAVSPTGRLFALGGDNPEIRVHETRTGKEIAHLAGHLGRVHSLAFSPDGAQLVSGSSDTTALVWDVAGLGRTARGPSVKLESGRLEELWRTLLEPNASRPYEGMSMLAGAPDLAVPFLKNQLERQTWPDPKEIPQLITDLDSGKFKVRETATLRLEDLGEAAVSALRKLLDGTPSAEVRNRALQVLARLATGVSRSQLRLLRTLEVLEQIGTPQARSAIETLLKPEHPAWLRQEARTTLERLTKSRRH
jgi:RNA polymerase sigma factor (sigma-70 family)